MGRRSGANPNPIVVPCHRVVRADGVLGGYSGGEGPVTKAKLLAREGVQVSAGKVNLSKYLFSDFLERLVHEGVGERLRVEPLEVVVALPHA